MFGSRGEAQKTHRSLFGSDSYRKNLIVWNFIARAQFRGIHTRDLPRSRNRIFSTVYTYDGGGTYNGGGGWRNV